MILIDFLQDNFFDEFNPNYALRIYEAMQMLSQRECKHKQ
jgi:hypothetical protein